MSNSKKIDALIRGIATRGAGFREAVQNCAVLIVQETIEHNNCSQALSLCSAVPMASDRVKLIQWFALVSRIRVTFTADVKKRRVGLAKPESKGFNPDNLDRAKATPYWTVGKSDDEQTEEMTSATFNSMVLRLAKRIRKQIDEGHVAANEQKIVTAKLAALEAVTTAVAA